MIMSVTNQAYITPGIIRWARKRTGISETNLAKKLSTKPAAIASWEDGKANPTMRQAERLAKALYIPFGYLFLETPPEQTLPLPDFRTLKDADFHQPSAEFTDLLNDVLIKHAWYREFLQQEGRSPLPFVGLFPKNSNVKEVAGSITAKLNISATLRKSCASWEDFLRIIISNAEKVGILVMRSGVVAGNPHRRVSTDEFRGFAICDDLAPLIYINGSDSKAAQIFTVAHELTHIWIGQTGISNEDLARKEEDNDVERLCNATAAEILVPEPDFAKQWQHNESIDFNLAALRSYYRVSSLVVLRRAYALGLIQWSQYIDFYRRAEKRYKEQAAKQQDGGGNFFASLLARNSSTFTNTVIAAAMEGKALYREAADLLNVKVSTIPKIAERLT